MPGFLDNWNRPGGSPPPFFSPESDLSSMAGWGMGTPSVVPGLPSVLPSTAAGITGTSAATGTAGAATGVLGKQGFGLNMPTAQLALTGLGTIGNLWAAFQAQKLAKEQFAYTKNVTDTNLANQIKTYNTGLTDRANNRAIVEGRTPDQTRAYVDANSLSRYGA